MSAADEIFPTKQHPDYVQTQWSKGWGYAVIGFGGAARMLTDQRRKMHASVDQIGLAIFYLQRHRVELTLKHALVSLGVEAVDVAKLGHDLDALWEKFGEVVRAKDVSAWENLKARHGEFVTAIDAADQGSFGYRYPIDKKGLEPQRAEYIDLDALQRHAEEFEYGIAGYLDWLDEHERLRREYAEEYGA